MRSAASATASSVARSHSRRRPRLGAPRARRARPASRSAGASSRRAANASARLRADRSAPACRSRSRRARARPARARLRARPQSPRDDPRLVHRPKRPQPSARADRRNPPSSSNRPTEPSDVDALPVRRYYRRTRACRRAPECEMNRGGRPLRDMNGCGISIARLPTRYRIMPTRSNTALLAFALIAGGGALPCRAAADARSASTTSTRARRRSPTRRSRTRARTCPARCSISITIATRRSASSPRPRAGAQAKLPFELAAVPRRLAVRPAGQAQRDRRRGVERDRVRRAAVRLREERHRSRRP